MEASKQLGLRVPASISKRLAAIARKENNRMSAVMRRLLTAALDREDAAHAASSAPVARRPERAS